MRDFHSIHLHWAGSRSLLIEWTGGKAQGVAVAPSIPGVLGAECTGEGRPDEIHELNRVPAICWREEQERLFEPLQLREGTEYYVDATLPISLEEANRRASADDWWPFTERLGTVFKRSPERYWKDKDGKITVTGRLNFGSHVGVADLSLDGGRRLLVEVACTKLNYFEEFKALLNDIADKVVTLLLQVDAATAVRFRQSMSTNTEPLVTLFHLRRLMAPEALPLAVESILHDAHSQLESEIELVPPERLRTVSPAAFVSQLSRMDFTENGPLAGLFRGYSPRKVPQERKTTTLDTSENRYVKEFLQGLLHHVEQLRQGLRKKGYEASLREAEHWSEQIDGWLSRPMWSEVGRFTHLPSNSQVLQKRTGYSDILEADLRMQVGLSLPWARGLQIATAADGDVRPIYELYEYWCFFTLRAVLRKLCGAEDPGSSRLVRISKDGVEIALRKGQQTSLTFKPKVGGEELKVHLFYNRRFSRTQSSSEDWTGSYTAVFYPDCSILVETSDRKHWLHFDAKYRLDFKLWKELAVDTLDKVESEMVTELTRLRREEDVQVYKLGDLYKMHTYRDALLGSRGAYILYPGLSGTEEVFLRAPGREYGNAEFKIPSVGAFPLKPGGSVGVDHLQQFLGEVLSTLASSGAAYQNETGMFLSKAKPTVTSGPVQGDSGGSSDKRDI